MRRLVASTFLLLASPASADDAGVAIVLSRSIAPYVTSAEGTQEVLRSGGVDAIQLHDMAGDPAAAGRIAGQVLRQHPLTVVTVGTEATEAMRQQVGDIPIVSSMVVHPDRLQAAGGPLLFSASMEVASAEQLARLKELLPKAKRLGIIYNPSLQTESAMARRQEAVEARGLELLLHTVAKAADMPGALTALLPTVDVLWLIPDETVLSPETVQKVLLETLRYRVAVLAPSLLFVKQGALLAVSGDYRDIGRQAGELALSLVSGKRPKASMVEARKSMLYLNLRTAKTLGITVPSSLIQQAEQVVQ